MEKNLPANAGDVDSIPGPRRSPGKEMATHSSILAWRIPQIEEPGGLQSMGSWVLSLHQEDPLKQEMATHSSIPA